MSVGLTAFRKSHGAEPIRISSLLAYRLSSIISSCFLLLERRTRATHAPSDGFDFVWHVFLLPLLGFCDALGSRLLGFPETEISFRDYVRASRARSAELAKIKFHTP